MRSNLLSHGLSKITLNMQLYINTLLTFCYSLPRLDDTSRSSSWLKIGNNNTTTKWLNGRKDSLKNRMKQLDECTRTMWNICRSVWRVLSLVVDGDDDDDDDDDHGPVPRKMVKFNPGLSEILITIFLLRECNSSLQNAVELLLWDTVVIYTKCFSALS